jgi:hypothetical protein
MVRHGMTSRTSPCGGLIGTGRAGLGELASTRHMDRHSLVVTKNGYDFAYISLLVIYCDLHFMIRGSPASSTPSAVTATGRTSEQA